MGFCHTYTTFMLHYKYQLYVIAVEKDGLSYSSACDEWSTY